MKLLILYFFFMTIITAHDKPNTITITHYLTEQIIVMPYDHSQEPILCQYCNNKAEFITFYDAVSSSTLCVDHYLSLGDDSEK